ncbi:unnamed protein product [Euphydryas editha]|nr:unnamed protein product [Euphydryas editha]
MRLSASSQTFCESNSTRSLLFETGDTLAGAYLVFRKDMLFLNVSIVSWRLFDGRFVATISAGRVWEEVAHLEFVLWKVWLQSAGRPLARAVGFQRAARTLGSGF